MLNPLSTEALVAWLEKQPPDQEYPYTDSRHCLFCQYMKATGLNIEAALPHHWRDTTGARHALPEGWHDIANDGSGDYFTFGDALRRARALLGGNMRQQRRPPQSRSSSTPKGEEHA